MDSSASSASESASAGAAVHERLRSQILRGELLPGMVLSQVALAEELGVSRTPLREALRRLQEEGLVEGQAQRKVRVAGFDPDDLDSTYAARITLEVLAISVAVPKMSDADLTALRADQVKMEARAGKRQLDKWETAHRAFHQRLIHLGGPQLTRTIAVMAERTERYRRILFRLREPRGWTHAALEHQAIIDACHERKASLAAFELARHLARTALALNAELAPEREPVAVRTALLLARLPAERADSESLTRLGREQPLDPVWPTDGDAETQSRAASPAKGVRRKRAQTAD